MNLTHEKIVTFILLLLISASLTYPTASARAVDPIAGASSHMLRDPFQRRTWWSNDRAWVQVFNGTHYNIMSSVDGRIWEISAILCAGETHDAAGESMSTFYDQATGFIHVALANYTSGKSYYRRGQPQNDGSVTLDPWDLVYYGKANEEYGMPSICVDTEGYPWVALEWINASADLMYQCHVLESGSKDGTWITAQTHNLTQVATSFFTQAPRALVLSMLAGKIGVLYAKTSDHVYFDMWDGTTWSVEGEIASLNHVEHGDFLSSVAILDDVHLSYLKDNPHSIRYRKRTYGVGWEASETTVAARASSSGTGAVMNWAKNDDSVRIFWSNLTDNHIYYRRRLYDGTWLDTVDWGAASGALTDARTIQVAYSTSGTENITFVYQIGTSSLFKLGYKNIRLDGQSIHFGWNYLTTLAADVAHDLKDVAASLNGERIQATIIIKRNATAEYRYEYGCASNCCVEFTDLAQNLTIYSTNTGIWGRLYTRMSYLFADSERRSSAESKPGAGRSCILRLSGNYLDQDALDYKAERGLLEIVANTDKTLWTAALIMILTWMIRSEIKITGKGFFTIRRINGKAGKRGLIRFEPRLI